MSDYWIALLVRVVLVIVVMLPTFYMLDKFGIDKLNFIIGMLIADAIRVDMKG